MGRLERLREVEREIEGSLQDASMGWTRVYRLVSEVAEERLWLDSYRSLASWMRSFGDRSKVSVNYLNRVLSAGRSYEAFQERSLAAGRPCPELSAAPVSALAVVEARRVSAGRPEAFDRLMGSLVSGETTPSEVRRMAAAGAGLRDRGRPRADASAPSGHLPEELLWALSPEALGATSSDPSRRFLWQAFPETSGRHSASTLVATDCLRQATLEDLDGTPAGIDLLWFAAVADPGSPSAVVPKAPAGVDFAWLCVDAAEAPDAASARPSGWGLTVCDVSAGTVTEVTRGRRRRADAGGRADLLEGALMRCLRRV